MLERIRHMLVKEFIQIFRDPRMKMVIFVVPVVQVVVFGYAATTDVRHIRTAVYDLDRTEDSRALVSRFEGSGYFDVVANVGDEDRAREMMDRGEAQLVLRTNAGFENGLRAGRTAEVQMIVDGTDSNTASIVLNYGTRIAQEFSRDALVSTVKRTAGAVRLPGEADLQTRAWFNANLESRNFFVPGVIANIILIITMLLTGMAVVREKEIGTMEQVMVTPIAPAEFILGKTVPFAIVGFIDVFFVTIVGVYWFDVPIRGSLPLLLFSTALYLMTTLGMGLLISTVSETQQQAMMTTFFYVFPAILLSGFMFPIANMPEVIQWATYLNPLRYFLVILRGIFLKGVGADVLWPQMAALAALGVATLWLASTRFRKTLV